MTKRTILSHRHILEKEDGTISKEWGGNIPICLVFPNYYHVGMSNLGFQLLYRHLNSVAGVVCERAFLPERKEWEEYIRNDTPLLSLESCRPLAQFQIIAFSLPFENDFLHLLSILQLAKITLKAQDRTARDPLIVAGGAAVSLNPEPIAPFIDLFFIGEGEEVLIDFLRTFQGIGRGGKKGFLEEVAQIEGVYVPTLYQTTYDQHGFIKEFSPIKGKAPQKVRRRWIKEPSRIPSYSAVLTPLTEFKEMFLIEVNRGCPRGCRFCAARVLYLPFRNRAMDTLIREADLGLHRGKKIGLVGSALADHPRFTELCEYIVTKGGKISIASIRADGITDRLANFLALSGHRTVALAPEAGSERLRKVVEKGFAEEEVLSAVEFLAANGINNLKLYFIIGLPTETWEDIEGIVALTKRIRHQMVRGGRAIGEITLSINPFIPKAWTPFQWHPFEEVKGLKEKIRVIKKGLQKTPHLRVLHELPKWGYVQTLLSMGDRRVAEFLLLALQDKGNWLSAFKSSYINPDFWVYRKKRKEENLPWDFIDHGLNKDTLWEVYKEAKGTSSV